jgi:hypothetical protein
MNQQYPHDPNQPIAPLVQPQPAPKTSHKGRTVAIFVSAVFVVFVVVGIGIALGGRGDQPKSAETPAAFKVTGTVTVEAGDGSEGTDGGDCATDGGYADIASGTQVTIKDESGKVIALGSLDPGHTSEVLTLPAFNSDTGIIEDRPQATKCVFGFSVPNVPEGKPNYVFEYPLWGELTYSRYQLEIPLALELSNQGLDNATP